MQSVHHLELIKANIYQLENVFENRMSRKHFLIITGLFLIVYSMDRLFDMYIYESKTSIKLFLTFLTIFLAMSVYQFSIYAVKQSLVTRQHVITWLIVIQHVFVDVLFVHYFYAAIYNHLIELILCWIVLRFFIFLVCTLVYIVFISSTVQTIV